VGRYDSTKTRVSPIFNRLEGRVDPWLERLLALPKYGHPNPLSWTGLSLRIDEIRYGTKEKPLPAPTKLLEWLIANATDITGKGLEGCSDLTSEKRRLLLDRDAAVISEARTLLASNRADGQWFVLEGPSYPDVFVSTPDLVVVIEGKRTERGSTTATTWMSLRHQLLRHMDSALDAANGRTVVGFFVVEGGSDAEVPRPWITAAADTISRRMVQSSLPHRSPAEQELISKGFLGVTTWAAVCREFGLDPGILPDTVQSHR
jgi:hypothetical protein